MFQVHPDFRAPKACKSLVSELSIFLLIFLNVIVTCIWIEYVLDKTYLNDVARAIQNMTIDHAIFPTISFTAVGEPSCTLSFVDMRGFGRWTLTSAWSENRGPCILQERDRFRSHVLGSLEARAFSKPICEVMLDQRYFNGVGNYLRAEALYR